MRAFVRFEEGLAVTVETENAAIELLHEQFKNEISCLQDRYASAMSALSICESPIEQLFLARFLGRREWVPILESTNLAPHFFWREMNPETERFRCRIFPQFELINTEYLSGGSPFNYRVDFVIHVERDADGDPFEPSVIHLRYAIEIDGHDFHERTKEQAKRDRSRDRNLSAFGYTVLRYTGSEVYCDDGSLIDQLNERIYIDLTKVIAQFGA
jgi:hypothetical protein